MLVDVIPQLAEQMSVGGAVAGPLYKKHALGKRDVAGSDPELGEDVPPGQPCGEDRAGRGSSLVAGHKVAGVRVRGTDENGRMSSAYVGVLGVVAQELHEPALGARVQERVWLVDKQDPARDGE